MVEWTGGTLPTFVTHLECSLTGERYPADTLQTLSKAGRPLLVRYDLDGVRRALPRERLAGRPQTLWRYRELLPVRRPGDVVAIYANNDLARNVLGWVPKYSLEDMLSTAWRWEQKIKMDESFYNSKFSELN